MNLILKGYWSNNPISIDEVIQNPELVLRVPVGMVTIAADVDKAYVDKQDSLLGDQLLAAIGKLQAQINNMGSGSGSGGGTACYPSFTGNAGKVLAVNATEDGVEWITLPSGGGEPPSIEILPDEMHFTTLAGSVDYVGTQGDQILLSDNSIVDITATNKTFTFNVPSGKHKVKLVESVGRNNYVSVGGEALVELHNFPTLSTVTKFNFTTRKYNVLPNLTKVPNVLPSNITNMSHMFYQASSFNQPLNNWNVSNVTGMIRMFYNASAFNQDLSMWCVSNFLHIPDSFNSGAPFLVGAKLPVWGTCPAP